MRAHLRRNRWTIVLTLAVAWFGFTGLATGDQGVIRVVGYGQVTFQGAGPERWAQRAHRAALTATAWHRRYLELHRAMLHRPAVKEAIELACDTYGYCAELWRKASCETGGSFNPYSLNRSSGAQGLFQFLPSTYASTPYAGLSVWSAYASALAAGWMHAHGRGSEWSCS